MQDLSPRLRALRRGGVEANAAIAPEHIQFSPLAFEVAPHDFEKLTVTVSVPADAPTGDYEVVFALGDDEPDLLMAFAVTGALTLSCPAAARAGGRGLSTKFSTRSTPNT